MFSYFVYRLRCLRQSCDGEMGLCLRGWETCRSYCFEGLVSMQVLDFTEGVEGEEAAVAEAEASGEEVCLRLTLLRAPCFPFSQPLLLMQSPVGKLLRS